MQGEIEQALAWAQAGLGVSLATVVETWGSAPRRVGAQMVVASDGAMAGSVSGGCVEGAVVLEALDALEDGKPRLLEYGISDGDAFAVGLACGGTIKVLVEPVCDAGLSLPLLSDLAACRAARRPAAYEVALKGGHNRVVTQGHNARFRQDRSGFSDDGETFVAIHNPPLRMVIVGAVHIAQHLADLAQMSGFDPIVVDPREAFGSVARFPNATLINDWPDAALKTLRLDARTAVVLLTHDPKLDDPALQEALGSKVFYIGALGSKKTHAARLERLEKAGFNADDCARIHGPVGLNIGSSNPAEIAVSIIAQIIDCLRRS